MKRLIVGVLVAVMLAGFRPWLVVNCGGSWWFWSIECLF